MLIFYIKKEDASPLFYQSITFCTLSTAASISSKLEIKHYIV